MNRIAEEEARTTPRDRARGVILRSEQTGGAFALVEYDIPPKRLVAPLHTHAREDEYSYVVSGTVGTQIGDEVVIGGPGELLSKPRGVPHTLWNPGDEWARVLEAYARTRHRRKNSTTEEVRIVVELRRRSRIDDQTVTGSAISRRWRFFKGAARA